MHLSPSLGKVLSLPSEKTPPKLSIIVPTFNECENVPELIRRLDATLGSILWEVIFVDDDSPDGTAQIVKKLAATDVRVRCIRRLKRRGLSGACVEGILSSSASIVAVMDADLQHDENILPAMYEAIGNGADLVVGSRYYDGESSAIGLSKIRRWGSDIATKLARRLLRTDLSDPMSGFFMIRRDIVEKLGDRLAPDGFKVLLDIVAFNPAHIKTIEIPYNFRKRLAGQSKLDSLVTAEYLGLLASKLSGGLLPVRFLMFAAIGISGVAVHLSVLQFVARAFLYSFPFAQLAATMVAMTWNFLLNNQLTYHDRRLKGLDFIYGLISFYLVCSFGTLANVGVASWLYEFQPNLVIAGLVGAILGSVFNYAATSVLTWRK